MKAIRLLQRLTPGIALLLLTAQTGFAADAPTSAPTSTPAAAPRAPARAITHVKGDVYRASNGGWYVAILDTPDGLLLVDTISTTFSAWLKEELAKKFPGKTVKYVILSHSHWDHSEGGRVFTDTAKFIAQEGFLRNMDGRYPALPGDMTDRNDNGLIDVAEFVDPAREHPGFCGMNAASVTSKDKDGDGRASPKEFFADTPPPDILYNDHMTLHFGGKTIQMVYPGKNHANDGTAVLFTDERVLFTVDFPADALVRDSMRSMPSACGHFDGHPLDEWIRSYRTLEALDFDISVGGHGSVPFTKKDITEGREFMEYLKREVESAMRKGLSLAQMKQTIMLEPYKDWRYYKELREANIEAAYHNLKTYR
jgi:glyoxylase-like metal-dependent hydrolase (beta-lactamase superfamily II)